MLGLLLRRCFEFALSALYVTGWWTWDDIRLREICSSICSLLENRMLYFDCIFTSLDYDWMNEVKTSSRRWIKWITLESPSFSSLTSHFRKPQLSSSYYRKCLSTGALLSCNLDYVLSLLSWLNAGQIITSLIHLLIY